MKTKTTLAAHFTLIAALAALPDTAHASLLSGEAADTAANVVSWIVLFVVPLVLIAVFWMLHVMPEKIAEKRHHPQTQAIHTLCLLSLFFGGLLWPLAWLWAFSKPVMYKLAYGTDRVDPHPPGEDGELPTDDDTQSAFPGDDVKSLRARIAELEAKLSRNTQMAKGA